MLQQSLNNESDLIDSFQEKGDQHALAALFKAYMPLIYGVCLKYLKERTIAQDMTMSIYEKLMIKLPGQQIDNFKSWLYVLCKNECLMQLRREQRQKEQVLKDSSTHFVEFEHFEHHKHEPLEEDLHKMEACIEKLKQAQKQSIQLFYLEKKCYQEVAEQMNEDLKKVKSHIQNGKRNLKICIEQLREQEQ